METKKVLMFPWLAHGHISPFVELAKRLAIKNFSVYICSSRVNLQNVKPKLTDQFSSSIELVELQLPSSPELPPHMHTTNGLPHHLIPTLIKTFDMAAPNFSAILQKLNPDLLISDVLQPWAAEIASSFNIPAVNFLVVGTVSATFGVHHIQNSGTEFPFPELFEALDHLSLKKKAPEPPPTESGVKSSGERFFDCLMYQEHFSNTILANSFTEIEGKYMDFLSVALKKKVVPVGPLVTKVGSEDEKSEILRWLDGKKPNSTIYVSFGSEFYLPKEDREELAHGLELSGVNFIWVVRFPKGEKITIQEAIPEGFLERVGERGVVVEWAPQMKILGHRSVAGFLSHCGWNSVLESLVFGVPIIALPMQLDQPWHTKVVEEAGVCVEAKRDREGNVQREAVATAIKEMVFEETGERLRKKASEISVALKKKERETIDCLAAELNRVCEENKMKIQN